LKLIFGHDDPETFLARTAELTTEILKDDPNDWFPFCFFSLSSLRGLHSIPYVGFVLRATKYRIAKFLATSGTGDRVAVRWVIRLNRSMKLQKEVIQELDRIESTQKLPCLLSYHARILLASTMFLLGG
jgi:hypothetical protein